MKIQYVSDLHLELSDNSKYIKKNPLLITGDVLLIAGDSHYYGTPDYTKLHFWKWASNNYEQVIVCMGNHEFYAYQDVSQMKNGFDLEIQPNVHIYYNSVVNLGNADLIVSTLWGHISENQIPFVEWGVNDFRRIKWGENKLSGEHFNELNQSCIDFIKKSVENSKSTSKIVLTHHLPSPLLVDECFKGSDLNGAFMCDLTDYITDSGINYWIYGHSHRNIDCQIGSTRLLSNQLGYVSYGENLKNKFDPGKFIEI